MATKSVDGFPIRKHPPLEVPNGLNEWSSWSPVHVVVMDFYINPAWVVWKNEKVWVADYESFTMLIKQWMEGSMWSSAMTKDAALDQFFEMAHYGEGKVYEA